MPTDQPASPTEPTFNLKAVVRETGLKPDTLRAWERRYGLPQPDRTSGGHRIYSQRDINILKWLVARQEEGLSISRAVDMWNSLVSEGHDPLQTMTAPKFSMPSASHVVGTGMDDLRDSWIQACLDFDERKAEDILAQAFALYPLNTVCLGLLQKGVVEIGQGWHEGTITVQQEHFASQLAMRRLEALIAATPAPTRPGRIMIGCAPEEAHTFSPLLLTLLLRRQGWEVIYLGANVPLHSVAETMDAARPHLIILSAQSLHTAATLRDMAILLERQRVPLAYGGPIFNFLPGLRQRIPGHFLGESLDLAVQNVKRLLSNASIANYDDTVEPPPSYHQTLGHFRERQALLEAEVWQTISPEDIPPAHLANINANVSRQIVAALKLGDIAFLGTDIGWLESIVLGYDLYPETLQAYLQAYHEAAQQHLNPDKSRLLLDWLARLNQQDETA